LRVLGICSFAGRGGCERDFALLLRHLPPDVERSALTLGDGPLRQLLEEWAIPAAAAPAFAGRPGVADLGRFTDLLYSDLRRRSPSVVWASAQKAALLAAPACRLAGVPLVWHKVDFSFDRLLARPLALASSGITGVSEAVTRPIGALRRRRVLGTVPHPVPSDFDVDRQPDAGRPMIGTIGRLVPYKGHHRIIEAAAMLRADFPSLRVIIVGEPVPEYPDYPRHLVELARDVGLHGGFELTGFTDEERLLRVLSELTVFVSATYRDSEGYGLEGRGRAIAEASWCGVPVIVSRAGGAKESVIDGRTGTVVDDTHPRILAEAIRPYLGDPQLVERVGGHGRSFAHSMFDAERAGRLLRGHLDRVASAQAP
jgi:glycosyltransferase involved in cell wall biosynthesis